MGWEVPKTRKHGGRPCMLITWQRRYEDKAPYCGNGHRHALPGALSFLHHHLTVAASCAIFVQRPTLQAHLQGGAADLATVATPRKSRFLQDFEEAAASLPVSPSASLPDSPTHKDPAPEATINPAAAIPAPFLALHWVSLGLHARAAHDKLQQLSVTLARCAVQRTVLSPAQDSASPPTQIPDEVNTICSHSLLCNLML